MPELPEVQSLVTSLSQGDNHIPPILNQEISDVQVFWSKTIAEPEPGLFIALLKNQSIVAAQRRGKFIHLVLSDLHLLIHLRMSGDLLMERVPGKDDTPSQRKHDRVHIVFTNGWQLVFIDSRKFGRMWLVEDPQSVVANLGPEPFAEELTPQRFYEMLSQHHRQIKPLLLDQTFIAGMGNIYTDKSLFQAGIHPLRTSDHLSRGEASALLDAIRKTLHQAILNNGTSIDWIYRGGNYQAKLQVYQQTGNPCKQCGMPVKRITVGQRGTHFCPHCQPQK